MPQPSGLHIPKPTKPRLTAEQVVAARSALKASLAASRIQIHARSLDLPAFLVQRFGARQMQLAYPIERRVLWTGPRLAYALSL